MSWNLALLPLGKLNAVPPGTSFGAGWKSPPAVKAREAPLGPDPVEFRGRR